MDKYYQHKAQYYETDQMGIIHHSNYIRWFEEARIDAMEQAGLGYQALEHAGVVSPVLSVFCEYKSMVHFNDIVLIKAEVKKYNGITMTIHYEVSDKVSGMIRCVGQTKHCFLNKEGHPVSLKKSYAEFDKHFIKLRDSKEEE